VIPDETTARHELTMLIIGRTAPRAADAILETGYCRPRTINNYDELESLPVRSVLLDVDGDVCQRLRGGWRAVIDEREGDPWLTDTLEVDLPAIVLYEPAVKK